MKKTSKKQYRIRDLMAASYVSSQKRGHAIIRGPLDHYRSGWDAAIEALEELKNQKVTRKEHQELFNMLIESLVQYLTG